MSRTLAEEFGYPISPYPAVQMPGMSEEIERFSQRVRFRIWLRLSAVAIPLLTIAVICYVFSVWWLMSAAAGLPLLILVAFATPLAERREARRLLENSPWQTWPCVVEETSPMGSKRLLLLAPDRTVAASFRTDIPQDAWLSMTDGRGLLWIAGDLRFNGLAALPGTTRFWKNTPETAEQKAPPTRIRSDDSMLDPLISEARSFAWGTFFS